MANKNKKHKITITVSDNELLALEDALIVWTLCKKHNKQIWDEEEGRNKTEQEIFKMQYECETCKRKNKLVHKKAWQVASRLFKVWDKTY